jgi:hypothetical protein
MVETIGLGPGDSGSGCCIEDAQRNCRSGLGCVHPPGRDPCPISFADSFAIEAQINSRKSLRPRGAPGPIPSNRQRPGFSSIRLHCCRLLARVPDSPVSRLEFLERWPRRPTEPLGASSAPLFGGKRFGEMEFESAKTPVPDSIESPSRLNSPGPREIRLRPRARRRPRSEPRAGRYTRRDPYFGLHSNRSSQILDPGENAAETEIASGR